MQNYCSFEKLLILQYREARIFFGKDNYGDSSVTAKIIIVGIEIIIL